MTRPRVTQQQLGALQALAEYGICGTRQRLALIDKGLVDAPATITERGHLALRLARAGILRVG